MPKPYSVYPVVLAALAVVPGAAFAQAQAPQPTPQTRVQVIARLNADYAAMDTNKDGALSRAEIAAGQARAAQAASAALGKRLEGEFAKLDTNKDKQLSLAEFKAIASARPTNTPDEALQQLDSNKDGKITAEEFRARALSVFDRHDSNKDGTLSVDEQRNAAAAMRR